MRKIGRRTQAPEPPSACRHARIRWRRSARLPPHSEEVGSKFQPCATPSSKNMISSGVSSCCAQSALDQNALHRFGHVEPGTANRCKRRQNAVLEKPEQHLRCIVSTQVIPDHQHPQQRQSFWQSSRHGQPFLPGEPQDAVRFGRQDRFFRQHSQDFSQQFFSHGCNTALALLVTPFMRTWPLAE